jgi:hypothetical protein
LKGVGTLLTYGLAVALSQENPHADPARAAPGLGIEVPIERSAPKIEGHPVTAVVVTQCNQLVAVYLTMSDSRLMRFDGTSRLPVDELLAMAYTAIRSERVEVGCERIGAFGYETHEPHERMLHVLNPPSRLFIGFVEHESAPASRLVSQVPSIAQVDWM